MNLSMAHLLFSLLPNAESRSAIYVTPKTLTEPGNFMFFPEIICLGHKLHELCSVSVLCSGGSISCHGQVQAHSFSSWGLSVLLCFNLTGLSKTLWTSLAHASLILWKKPQNLKHWSTQCHLLESVGSHSPTAPGLQAHQDTM